MFVQPFGMCPTIAGIAANTFSTISSTENDVRPMRTVLRIREATSALQSHTTQHTSQPSHMHVPQPRKSCVESRARLSSAATLPLEMHTTEGSFFFAKNSCEQVNDPRERAHDRG